MEEKVRSHTRKYINSTCHRRSTAERINKLFSRNRALPVFILQQIALPLL